MLASVRNALSQGQDPPPRFRYLRGADVDFEAMTPEEFWTRFIVNPGTPMGRPQTAEDMGRAAAFLVSEDAKNITGQVLHVDGGMTMR